jgi:hypothetical protein
MINNNNKFDMTLFQRLYDEFLKIKVEYDDEPTEYVGHEWIDLDQVISNNQPKKKDETK